MWPIAMVLRVAVTRDSHFCKPLSDSVSSFTGSPLLSVHASESQTLMHSHHYRGCGIYRYSDGACSFMTSIASAECAMAAPALISAATQTASMISSSVAPF